MQLASSSMTMSARQPPPGTTGQHALEALRRDIITGQLGPGDRVRQEDVAESLGISIGPVREALAVLEQEGQVTYRPRRGYFVTELRVEDLEEIYELRRILEERAARMSLPTLDEDAIGRIAVAARDCMNAVEAGNVSAELEANRRFHFAILESPEHLHTMRLIRLLWDSTEAYRAFYYNSAAERKNAIDAHDRILAAIRAGSADDLVRELDAHRERALLVLKQILTRRSDAD